MAAAAPPQVFIDAATLRSILSYSTLIPHLRTSLPSLSSSVHTPLRHIHSLSFSPSSSFLLMPSWSSSPVIPYLGVKLVTHFPQNSPAPAVHASYVLFSAASGAPLASLDGTELTLRRTAAVSALASLNLSLPTAKTLTIIGAGALAPHLIRAHFAARPSLQKVVIWNRTEAKAAALAAAMRGEGLAAESEENLEAAVAVGDIVSCATNSEVALVRGAALRAGAHLDLVGSFRVSMKECDDEALRRGRVFVDNWAAAEEAGELVGAFERGVIGKEDIKGTLVELIEGKLEGRVSDEEITVFKSVGSAAVDLISAQLVYETYMKNQVA